MIDALLIVLSLVGLIAISLIFRKRTFNVVTVTIMAIFSLIVLIVILPNFANMRLILCKKTKVRVIDKDTNKPIAGAYVKIGYLYASNYLLSSSHAYNSVKTVYTDINGEFEIPKVMPMLNIYFKPIYTRTNEGVVLAITKIDSPIGFTNIRLDESKLRDRLDVKMATITSDVDEITTIIDFTRTVGYVNVNRKEEYIPSERDFILKSYRFFENQKCMENDVRQDELLNLISTYQLIGERAKSIELMKCLEMKKERSR